MLQRPEFDCEVAIAVQRPLGLQIPFQCIIAVQYHAGHTIDRAACGIAVGNEVADRACGLFERVKCPVLEPAAIGPALHDPIGTGGDPARRVEVNVQLTRQVVLDRHVLLVVLAIHLVAAGGLEEIVTIDSHILMPVLGVVAAQPHVIVRMRQPDVLDSLGIAGDSLAQDIEYLVAHLMEEQVAVAGRWRAVGTALNQAAVPLAVQRSAVVVGFKDLGHAFALAQHPGRAVHLGTHMRLHSVGQGQCRMARALLHHLRAPLRSGFIRQRFLADPVTFRCEIGINREVRDRTRSQVAVFLYDISAPIVGATPHHVTAGQVEERVAALDERRGFGHRRKRLFRRGHVEIHAFHFSGKWHPAQI